MGLPWEKRGARMDETIDIVRGLTAGGWFEYDGDVWQLDRCKITPVSAQPIPILVGGHSAPALRRAAQRGDGWIHAGGDAGELAEMIPRVQRLRAEYGRERDPFEIHAMSIDAYTPDGVRRLEDAASPTRSSASGGPTRPSPTRNRWTRRSTCSAASPTA